MGPYRITSLGYAALLLLMECVGLLYDSLSRGLAEPGEGGPFFCRELLSSGGDDSGLVSAFAAFLVPASLRLARLSAGPAGYEGLVFLICLVLSCASLALARLDCGAIVYTAFGVPDPMLAAALVALPVSGVLLLKLYFARRQGKGR